MQLNIDPIITFFDLLYWSNGVRLKPSDKLTLGTPKATSFSPPTSAEIVLTLSDTDNPSVRGKKTFFYHRYNLSILESLYPEIAVDDYQVNSLDLIDTVNGLYDLQLKPEDILEETIDSTQIPYKLKANPGSLIWSGYVKLNLKFKTKLTQTDHLYGFVNSRSLTTRKKLTGFSRNPLASVKNLIGFKPYPLVEIKQLSGFQTPDAS